MVVAHAMQEGFTVLPVAHSIRSTHPSSILFRQFCGAAALTCLMTSATASTSYAVTTKTVCPSGCDTTSIQGAVNAWLDDDVIILVSAGTYRLSNELDIDNKDGSAGHRAILRANGTVIIDCADDFGSTGLWSVYSGTVYRASRSSTLMAPPATQVFVDDVRYTYVSGAGYSSLTTGQWGYDASGQYVYVNVGGANPGSRATYIGDNTRQRGIEVRNTDYLEIDGFTILRASEIGIDVTGASSGTRMQHVTVKNCTVAQCWEQGIYYKWTSNGVITNNVSRDNSHYGIYLFTSDHCDISRNHAYRNDNQLSAWGGRAGIKVGDSGDSTDVTDVTVDYNVVYDNEDSGIDLKGASKVAVRRNISYSNGDHGFDNNVTSRTVFLNNVAFRNDHSGISVESTSRNVSVFNNIFVHNGVDGSTLAVPGDVCELQVFGTTGFESNHNVFLGLMPGRVNSHWARRFATIYPTFPYATFAGYRDSNATNLDTLSYSSLPAFADTNAANFIVTSTTDNVVDAAKTNMTGWLSPMWLSTDPNGLVPHNTSEADAGSGSPAYADIGAYEFDTPPGAPVLACGFGTQDGVACWTTKGDDNETSNPASYQVFDGLNAINGASGGSVAPGTGKYVTFGLQSCSSHSISVVTYELDNGRTSTSNVVEGSTLCSGNVSAECDGFLREDEESSQRRVFSETDPIRLDLGRPGPNPTTDVSVVRYDMPRSAVGKPFELVLFDVTGRKASTVASGIAKSGRFTESIMFRDAEGRRLRSGMYFLRLRAGDEELRRTLVLSR